MILVLNCHSTYSFYLCLFRALENQLTYLTFRIMSRVLLQITPTTHSWRKFATFISHAFPPSNSLSLPDPHITFAREPKFIFETLIDSFTLIFRQLEWFSGVFLILKEEKYSYLLDIVNFVIFQKLFS